MLIDLDCISSKFKYILFFILFSLISVAPPFQSPDEFAHYTRSYSLLKFNFFEPTVEIEQTLNDYFWGYEQIPYHYDRKLTDEKINSTKHLRWKDKNNKVQRGIVTAIIYVPFIYLPQTVVIEIGRICNFSIHNTYLIGRIINVLLCLSILNFAFYFRKPNLTTLLILCMPMTLFQMSYTTPDGILFCLVVLIFSLFLKLINDAEINYKYMLILTFAILIFCGHRLNCVPFLALPSIVFLFKSKIKQAIFWLAGYLLFFVLWFFLYKIHVSETIKSDYTLSYKGFYYLTHINETARILFSTLTNNDLLHFYWKSFIGQLGWLDYALRGSKIRFLTIFLIISCFLSFRIRENYKEVLLALLLVLISFFLIFICLLVQWTTFPNATLIEGIQGRYFIPIALAVSCLFTENSISTESKNSKLLFWKNCTSSVIFFLFVCYSVYVTITATLLRYYAN